MAYKDYFEEKRIELVPPGIFREGGILDGGYPYRFATFYDNGGYMGKEKKDVKIEKLFCAALVTKSDNQECGLHVHAFNVGTTKEAALSKALAQKKYQFGGRDTDAFIIVGEVTEMTEPPKPLTETLIPFKFPE